ncbi:MAG: hypothetical protein CVU91_08440 [Firmicutes bacterium HGW-Firmicutes-16]|nr:MAG: hypothetical protein CVU91_08440 [Firmicutes bacterium HGW-Firmicutes-16]
MRRAKLNTIATPVFRIKFDSGFILLFALIWFFDESGFLAALIPSMLMHELGHIIFLHFFGARPTKLGAALSGLKIDYSGVMSDAQEMLVALAGPAFGLLFSFLCAWFGRLWDSEYLLMCAGLGFIINIFNFLPSEPLDGGRVLGFFLRALLDEERAWAILRGAGLITATLLVASGLYLLSRGLGPALFLAGLWLFILQQKKSCK